MEQQRAVTTCILWIILKYIYLDKWCAQLTLYRRYITKVIAIEAIIEVKFYQVLGAFIERKTYIR